mgnify:FL=1
MKQGQTTLEYVYLIGLAAAALIALLVFISRSFQGDLRVQADKLGEQYSPRNMRTNITQVTTVKLRDTDDGTNSTSNTSTAMTNRGKEEVVKSLKQESF